MKSVASRAFAEVDAVLGASPLLAATSAQAGGPPADPGWAGIPHCTVPNIEGTLLTSAEEEAARLPVWKPGADAAGFEGGAEHRPARSSPQAGTQLAPGHQGSADRRQVIKASGTLGAVAPRLPQPRRRGCSPRGPRRIRGSRDSRIAPCPEPGGRPVGRRKTAGGLGARCTVSAVMRQRSSVRKGRVVSVVPRAGNRPGGGNRRRPDRQLRLSRGRAPTRRSRKRPNAIPSVSVQCENQPTCGIGCLSSAWPPASRTLAIDASMSSVSK